ncbi:ABC-F family ATP-binding cassette domain-containing protein [Nonomuraea sp. NPDC050790]|uniref:ABC-F family ATP-binding cassette domain-containing protein n=1 Tax=Nonomuraea sp. NPDC050790 TaxID=3364371 RepID=UPI003791C2E8
MRAAQLALSDIIKRYEDRVVLDRVTFTVKPGEKVGIIGDNGSGKSTLLRLIAGVEAPDNGELTVVAPGGVGYLPQALDLPAGSTVGDAIDWALRDLRDLESRIRTAETRLASADTTTSRASDADGVEAGRPAGVEARDADVAETGGAVGVEARGVGWVEVGGLEVELAAYGELVAAFEARGGYEADARVEVALHGLGLPGLDRARPLDTLSGGERSRLALAATLAAAPELLLLDEPTNDLDDQAVTWLEEHLRAHRGTVVAITHDRVFLDRITSTILEVDQSQVRRYGNGYSGYLTAKAAERAAWALEHEEWKNELARHATLVDANASRLGKIPRKVVQASMGTGAWRARSRTHGAMSRIRQSNQRLDWLRTHPVPPPPVPLHFTPTHLTAPTPTRAPVSGSDQFSETPHPTAPTGPDRATRTRTEQKAAPRADEVAQLRAEQKAAPRADEVAQLRAEQKAAPRAGEVAGVRCDGSEWIPLVELDKVRVGERLWVEGLRILPGERLLVTGPNGAGKSTLIRVLAGELTPDTGTVKRPPQVGHLRQEDGQEHLDRTVLSAFAQGRTGSMDEHADALLSLGLFRPADLRLRVGQLSYGQRRRIDLARLVTRQVDLLLLDEPTNHLSPLLVEQLEQALSTYKGALVIVTHDRRMRAAFQGSRLELKNGRPSTACG